LNTTAKARRFLRMDSIFGADVDRDSPVSPSTLPAALYLHIPSDITSSLRITMLLELRLKECVTLSFNLVIPTVVQCTR
jgi:hypothetical protein